MHLKPPAGCQISTLLLGFEGWWDPIHIPWKITEGRQRSLPLGFKSKVLPGNLTDLKSLAGIMHLKPTAGCQISTLIFGFWADTKHIP